VTFGFGEEVVRPAMVVQSALRVRAAALRSKTELVAPLGLPHAGRAEEAIPIVEEIIRIGKRQIEGGRVHIRCNVVETRVQEQVSLG
jgi:hypothetical protein